MMFGWTGQNHRKIPKLVFVPLSWMSCTILYLSAMDWTLSLVILWMNDTPLHWAGHWIWIIQYPFGLRWIFSLWQILYLNFISSWHFFSFMSLIMVFPLQAYLIACVWNCYRYVRARSTTEVLIYVTTNDTTVSHRTQAFISIAVQYINDNSYIMTWWVCFFYFLPVCCSYYRVIQCSIFPLFS
jgi:hypothetical protein